MVAVRSSLPTPPAPSEIPLVKCEFSAPPTQNRSLQLGEGGREDPICKAGSGRHVESRKKRRCSISKYTSRESRETVKDGIVKATWKEGREGKKWLEEGIKAADGNWERALPRRLPSNSSSKLCAKTAFGMVHREQLCDNEP